MKEFTVREFKHGNWYPLAGGPYGSYEAHEAARYVSRLRSEEVYGVFEKGRKEPRHVFIGGTCYVRE